MHRTVLMIALLFSGGATAFAQGQLPEGPGKAETVKVCGVCHEPLRAASVRLTRDGWQDLIAKMISLGAKGSDEDLEKVLDYLSSNFRGRPEAAQHEQRDRRGLESVAAMLRKEAAAWIDYRGKKGGCKTLDDLKKAQAWISRRSTSAAIGSSASDSRRFAPRIESFPAVRPSKSAREKKWHELDSSRRDPVRPDVRRGCGGNSESLRCRGARCKRRMGARHRRHLQAARKKKNVRSDLNWAVDGLKTRRRAGSTGHAKKERFNATPHGPCQKTRTPTRARCSAAGQYPDAENAFGDYLQRLHVCFQRRRCVIPPCLYTIGAQQLPGCRLEFYSAI